LINLKRHQYLQILSIAVVVLLAGCTGATDADNDGLNKSIETKHGLDDTLADTDGDRLIEITSKPGTECYRNWSIDAWKSAIGG